MVIRPFQIQDQVAAKELILAGLVEHWGWLDESKNHDLIDIAANYADAVFLVGIDEGQLVATGALLPRGEGTAEIVRMSVAKAYRRRGYGREMLKALLQTAREKEITQVVLETTSTWADVIQFYESLGFKQSHEADGDTYFIFEMNVKRDA